MRLTRPQRLLLVEIGTTLAIIAAVWRYTETSTNFAVPAMSDVIEEFRDAWLFERFRSDVVPTLMRLLVGFGLSSVMGVALGLALGSSKALRLFLQPTISLWRSIPAVALIPPLIIVLGIGDSMKIFLVVAVCIWPVALNTSDGVINIDRTMLMTAQSYRLSRAESLRFVVFPAVSPRVFAGMRSSFALALILVIAGEYLAGTDGVGSFVARAQQTYDIAAMWAGIALMGILGYVLNLLFLLVQRRVLHWQQTSDAP